jgi:prolyl-tRNA synthetase
MHTRHLGDPRRDLLEIGEIVADLGDDDVAVEAEDEAGPFRGWVKVPWSRPEGAKLEAIADRLKALKLTIRNAPLGQGAASGVCVFTGEPARESILIARAY